MKSERTEAKISVVHLEAAVFNTTWKKLSKMFNRIQSKHDKLYIPVNRDTTVSLSPQNTLQNDITEIPFQELLDKNFILVY